MKFAELIREIGRGAEGARPLDAGAAETLFGAMLDGAVPDLELGAIVASLRMKGETVDELAGFLAAAAGRLDRVACPRTPVILPSYNGARRSATLTPLLALALQALKVPVLVHGNPVGFGRVTSFEVLAEFGIPLAADARAVERALANDGMGAIAIDALSAPLARLLALRARLGLRNAAHSIVKMLNPCRGPAVVVAAGTHPPYLESMRRILQLRGEGGLVLRATEGEPYANPRRRPGMELIRGGVVTVQVDAERDSLTRLPTLPESPDVATTARWTGAVLRGDLPLPASLAWQMACCLVGVDRVDSLPAGLAMVRERFEVMPDVG